MTIDAIAILIENLELSKLNVRRMFLMLPPEHKTQRIKCDTILLNHLGTDRENFYARIITGYETWILQYDPESKIQSKKGLSVTPLVQRTVLWDSEGVVLKDFLED